MDMETEGTTETTAAAERAAADSNNPTPPPVSIRSILFAHSIPSLITALGSLLSLVSIDEISTRMKIKEALKQKLETHNKNNNKQTRAQETSAVVSLPSAASSLSSSFSSSSSSSSLSSVSSLHQFMSDSSRFSYSEKCKEICRWSWGPVTLKQ